MAPFRFNRDALNKLKQQISENLPRRVQERLNDLPCPTHGEVPQFIATGQGPKGPTFDLKACCPPAMERAKSAVREMLRDDR